MCVECLWQLERQCIVCLLRECLVLQCFLCVCVVIVLIWPCKSDCVITCTVNVQFVCWKIPFLCSRSIYVMGFLKQVRLLRAEHPYQVREKSVRKHLHQAEEFRMNNARSSYIKVCHTMVKRILFKYTYQIKTFDLQKSEVSRPPEPVCLQGNYEWKTNSPDV